MPKFEVMVSDFWLTVKREGKELICLSVLEGGQTAATFPGIDDILFDDNGTPPAGQRIEVTVAHREVDPALPLPRMMRQEVTEGYERTIRTERPEHVARRGNGRTYDSKVEKIGEHDRDTVLDAILDSHLDNPNMSTARRRDETDRLAAKFGLRPMQVAGVRAALTRGRYGNYDHLLDQRRKLRQRSAT